MRRIKAGSLLRRRDAMIASIIKATVRETLFGVTARECVTCGHMFETRHHNHYFCRTDCRKRWYAGMFVRRKARRHNAR